MLGLMGYKLGMTRIYTDDGVSIGVTAVELGPCTVVRRRTREKNGYTALQLGFGAKRANLLNKPERVAYEKIKQDPRRVLREYRVSAADLEKFSEGQTITCEIFQAGQMVDVRGTSKGRGFAGVVKRHHMAGFDRTHGTHEFRRHGGSIGCRAHPGRVHLGKRMAGHMGSERVTTQNIQVVKVIPEDNLLLLRGAVPGPNQGVVEVLPAAKVKVSKRRE
ncbi:MAG: 50S ribosomal protein L3 [Deltaproteobacteria bacterium]|nr:50S ribosomal protein L3 [Deltaproteobacteria bacterium]